MGIQEIAAASPRFVVDEAELARMEMALAADTSSSRLPLLVELAWHLRQRDAERARTLVAQAHVLLASAGQAIDEAARQSFALRLSLVEAEIRWLFDELDAARALADGCVERAAVLGDPACSADAHWIVATIAVETGDSALRDSALARCEVFAHAAGDAQRILIARAAQARWAVFADLRATRERWGPVIGEGPWPAGTAAWVHDYLANVASLSGDFAAAIRHRFLQREDAVATGQWKRGIGAFSNLAGVFADLNDFDAALEWMRQALDESRRRQWPASIAVGLMQLGEVLHRIGRLEHAREVLLEGRAMFASKRSESRDCALTVRNLGEVYLDRGEWALAIEAFSELKVRAQALNHPDLMIEADSFQAAALAGTGRLDEALQLTERALERCRAFGRGGVEVSLLTQLARLQALRREAHPDDAANAADDAVLGTLRQALELGQAIEGYRFTGALHDALAAELARRGDWRAAYEMSRQAAATRQEAVSAAALSRSVAIQISHETELVRAETEHHRSLAATLEGLSAIGRDIARHLDEPAIFDALQQNVDRLLDVQHLGIWILAADAQTLTLTYGVTRGSKSAIGLTVRVDDPIANVARCARSGEEITLNDLVSTASSHIPGTGITPSAMFAPLQVGQSMLGVMTVQSSRAQAYGERERLVFRTLCAYGAIGLHNARAVRGLEGALADLRQASLTDPLTQLRNRRFLVQHIEDEIAVTLRRQGQDERVVNDDLVFLMIDIDHFKSVNDQFGHDAGDAVLVEVARRLRAVARESDFVVRWGGEEFLVVARATDALGATALAERFRVAVVGTPIAMPHGETLVRSCSIGFAGFPFHREDPRIAGWAHILELADHALFMAKNAGRNRWVGLRAAKTLPTREEFAAIRQDPREALAKGALEALRAD